MEEMCNYCKLEMIRKFGCRTTNFLLLFVCAIFAAFAVYDARLELTEFVEETSRESATSRRFCLEFICSRTAFNLINGSPHRLYAEDGFTPRECRACQQCTDNGFSVCAQPKFYDHARKDFVWKGLCECSHTIPRTCRRAASVAAAENRENRGHSRRYQLCYLSSVKKPPAPQAMNVPNDVVVTVEQFWLSDYWRALHPNNLTFFYEFVVKDPSLCEGQLASLTSKDLRMERRSSSVSSSSTEFVAVPTTLKLLTGHSETTGTGKNGTFLCHSWLHVEMYSGNGGDASVGNKFDDLNFDDVELEEPGIDGGGAVDGDVEEVNDIYDYDDNDNPPEVHFERGVFVGARRARLYYELGVERPRQLIQTSENNGKFVDKSMVITSKVLEFDLQPEIYGRGSFRKDGRKSKALLPTTTTTSSKSGKSANNNSLFLPLGAKAATVPAANRSRVSNAGGGTTTKAVRKTSEAAQTPSALVPPTSVAAVAVQLPTDVGGDGRVAADDEHHRTTAQREADEETAERVRSVRNAFLLTLTVCAMLVVGGYLLRNALHRLFCGEGNDEDGGGACDVAKPTAADQPTVRKKKTVARKMNGRQYYATTTTD